MRYANNTYKKNKFSFTKDENFIDALGTIVKGSSVHFPKNRNHNAMVSFSITPEIFTQIATPIIIPTISNKHSKLNKAPNWRSLINIFHTTSWKEVYELYKAGEVKEYQYEAIKNSPSFGLVGSDDNNQLMTLDIDNKTHKKGTKVDNNLVKELQSNLFNGDHSMIYNFTQSGGLHVYMTSKLLHGSSTKTVSYSNKKTKTKFDMDIKSNNSYVVLKGENYGNINFYVRYDYFINHAKKVLTDSNLFGQNIADAYKDFFSPVKSKNDLANINQFKFDAFNDKSKIIFLLVIAYMNQVNIFNYQSADSNVGNHKLITSYSLGERYKIAKQEKAKRDRLAFIARLKPLARGYEKLREKHLQTSRFVQKYLNDNPELKQFMQVKGMLEPVNLTPAEKDILTRSRRTKAYTHKIDVKQLKETIIRIEAEAKPEQIPHISDEVDENGKRAFSMIDNPDRHNYTNKPEIKKNKEKNSIIFKHDPIELFKHDVAKARFEEHKLNTFTNEYKKGIRNSALLSFSAYLYMSNWSKERASDLIYQLDAQSNNGFINQSGIKLASSELDRVINNGFSGNYRSDKNILESILGFNPYKNDDEFIKRRDAKGNKLDRNGNVYRVQQNIFTNTNKHYNVICDGIVRVFRWLAKPPLEGMTNLNNYYREDYYVESSYAKLARVVNKQIMRNYKKKVTEGSLKNVMHLLFKPISHFNVYDKVRWFELKLNDKNHTDNDFEYNSDTFAKFKKYVNDAHKVMTDAEIKAKSYRFNEMLQNYGKNFLGYAVSSTIVDMLSLKIDHIGVGRNSLHRFEMHLEKLDFNKDYKKMLAKEKQSNSLFARINASKLAYEAFLAKIKSINVAYDKANSEDNLHNQDSAADTRIGGLFTYAQQTILNNQTAQSAKQIIQNNLLRFDKISHFIQAKPRNGP